MLARLTRDPQKLAKIEADLAGPPFPEPLSYLWKAFVRLQGRRSSNGFGVNPIGWAEIDAFCRLTSTRLDPWEIEIIELLDNLSLVAIAKSTPKPGKPGPS